MKAHSLGRLLTIAGLLAIAANVMPPALFAAGTANTSDVTLADVGPGHRQRSGPNGELETEVCSHAVAAGEAHCDSHVRIDRPAKSARPSPGGQHTAGTLGNGGAYGPAYLRSAYNLSSLSASAGAGKTIAVVAAYDDITAQNDLAFYRAYFGLPPVPSFTKLNQNGIQGFYPPANIGWSQEISLDLDMASAICPNCNILLVEANSSYLNDLATAVNTAASRGAVAINNSYGAGEFNGENGFDSAYSHPGVAITASSGDNGYGAGAQYPAASPHVTAVGGTSLNQVGANGSRNATETVWSGAGSGCSAYEPKPAWQKDTGCGNRTVVDVAAVADPSTGVWGYVNGSWYIFGGTSAAAPIVAATYALAGNVSAGLDASSYSYAQTSQMNDVTSGSNGACGSYMCQGEPGYDGPTGNGTPNGAGAFSAPSVQAPTLTSISPTSGTTAGGTSVTISGANLSGASKVMFGTTAGTITASSASQITATSPAESAGTVNVTVTTPSGTTNTSAADQFTYVAPTQTPTVSSLSPTSGSTAGGTSVTISGSSLTGATKVTFGSTAASSFTVNSDSQITATSPAESAGSVDVTVSTPGGTSTTATGDQFTYVTPSQTPPSVSGVSPSSGSTAGGTSVTISGTNLTGATGVSFGGTSASSFTVKSASQVTATSPARSSGTVDVTVTTAAGTSSTSTGDQFTYVAAAQPPAVTGVSPSAGPAAGGTSVTISGSNLSGATKVSFGGTASSSFTVNSGSRITATSPAESAGSADVTVTTGAGTSSTSGSDRFTYTAAQPNFSIAALQSNVTAWRGGMGIETFQINGTSGNNSTVTLSVSGLPGGVSASFSPNPATVYGGSIASSLMLISIGASASPGNYTLSVTGKDTTGASRSASFTLTVN